MGIEDREWYRDAQRKRLDNDYRYDPKLFRRTPLPPSGRFSVWRTLLLCLAVYGAISLFQDLRHKLPPDLQAWLHKVGRIDAPEVSDLFQVRNPGR